VHMNLADWQRPLAVAEIATGLGILLFWAAFFTIGLVPANAPPCYLAFEHSFPLPDGVLAAGLLAAGTLLRRGRAAGAALSLMCAGGLLFLGLIDVAFNLQNGMYTASLAGGLAVAAINLWCIVLGSALALAFVPTTRAQA